MFHRIALLGALALAYGCMGRPVAAQSVQVVQDCAGVAAATGPGGRLYTNQYGGLCVSGSGTGAPGGSATSPTFTTPAGVTRTRLTCTLPAYATGGNIVCTDQAGAQTTTACAANTACLVSGNNQNRKTALATVRTAGVTCDVGYSATVAPGNAIGIDGSATAGGQGGSLNETPAHVGPYYAACPSAASLVFVQGQ